MGRRKKLSRLMWDRRNENSIRENDVILLQDPSHGDEITRPLPNISLELIPTIKSCSSNFTWCRLGCICESINTKNLDINKHCRDTGFAECIFGCVCANFQEGNPQLQTYKQLTYEVENGKGKQLKWNKDDDECGFVPPGTGLNLEDGRPKRKSQPPERFRHDVGGERGDKGSKRIKLPKDKETGEKRTGRARRHSGERKTLPARRNRAARSCSNAQNYAESNDNESDDAARSKHKKTTNGVSSPKTDLPKKTNTAVGPSTASPCSSTKMTQTADPSKKMEKPSVIYGRPLSVAELEYENELIYTIIRTTNGRNKIVSFVEWTNKTNFRPSVSFIGNFLRSKKIQDQNDCSTILRLPYEDSNNIGWYFYDIPESFNRGLFIMFPNLHAIIATILLQVKIDAFKPKEEGEIHIINISDINSNKHDQKELEGSVYLLLEYDGAIVMGTSPTFYRKPKGETLYVPGESDALFNNENQEGSNATSSNSSEASESGCNSSDQTDGDESDSDVKNS